jgi:O-antigen/teichoic acid export membrane protein
MFSPLISQMHSQNKHKELKSLFTCITRWIFALSLPLYLLLAWYSVSIGALFGDEYISAQYCIIVLCLGQIVNALTGPSGNMLLMSGYAFINLWTNLLGLVLIIVLNIVLVPEYGIVGSALAGGISLSVVNLIRVFLTWKKLDLHPYELGYYKPVISALMLVLILVYIGPDRDEILGILSLLFYGVLGMIGYSITMLALGLNKEDRYIFSKIRKRLTGAVD